MKEFKTENSYGVIGCIIYVPFILAFGWMLLSSIFDMEGIDYFQALFFIFCVVILAYCIISLLDIEKSKIIFTDSEIIKRSTLVKHRLTFKEIEGYIEDDGDIIIYAKDKDKKPLKIPKHIEESERLLAWFEEHFTDLGEKREHDSTEEILANHKFGKNKAKRNRLLQQANRLTWILNATGGIAAYLALPRNGPYQLFLTICIAMPPIVIAAMIYFKGLIRLIAEKGSAYLSVWPILVCTSVVLMIRAYLDFELVSYMKVWLFASILAIFLTIITLLVNKGMPLKKLKFRLYTCGLLVLFIAYSFGAVIYINCYYDPHTPILAEVEVVDKRISESGITKYVKLAAWEDISAGQEVVIRDDAFERIEVGNTIQLYHRKGRFDIPWYIVVN